MKIIIANSNPTYTKIVNDLSLLYTVEFISTKEELTYEKIVAFGPTYIFFPHWSYYIPEKIYSNFKCVVFHMTDLPYGRGGSPLQNLILRGHTDTKLSAIEVVKEIDAGRVYLKVDLSLEGKAREIFKRCEVLIIQLIQSICTTQPTPLPQKGDITIFERRKPADSDLKNLSDPEVVHNYIRMLDADGYPKAYIETENFRFEFTNSTLNEEDISAHVRIIKK